LSSAGNLFLQSGILARGTGVFSPVSAFAGAAALGPGTGLSGAGGLDVAGSAATAAGCCVGGAGAGSLRRVRLAVAGCGPGRPAAGGAWSGFSPGRAEGGSADARLRSGVAPGFGPRAGAASPPPAPIT